MSVTHAPKSANVPQNPSEFYQELTSRNRHFVEADVQSGLRRLKILIAGCGSTGGACIEALARAGVMQFWLADNGDYELSNLNRQHARLENLGQNKARFHANEVKSINPFAQVTVSETGINLKNVDEFVQSVDLVFDAVDITTPEGIKAKILLHKKCEQYRKPVLSGLDLGYLQWGCSYDYRREGAQALNGSADSALATSHPIAAIFKMFPVKILPTHSIPLVLDLIDGRTPFASQIGCTSDALSAIIVPAVLRFVEYGELLKGWHWDTSKYRYTFKARLAWWWRGFSLRRQLHSRLAEL